MIFRVAFVATLLAALLTACTVTRLPGGCDYASVTTMRTKNRALLHNSVVTTIEARSC